MIGTGALGLAPHWWWLIAAIVLAVAEILAPGFFLIWLAVAAMLTGFVTMILHVPLAPQLGLFAVAAIAAVYAARRWLRANPTLSSDPLLNDRVARMTGSLVEVVEAVGASGGRVRVDDGVWSARGPDLAVGRMARITGIDGNCLLVEGVKDVTQVTPAEAGSA